MCFRILTTGIGFWILSFLLIPGARATPIILDGSREVHEMGLALDILEDPVGSLTLDDVRSDAMQGRWQQSRDKVPNFGFTRSVYWARFTLVNKTDRIPQWLLEFTYPMYNRIELHRPSNQGYVRTLTGDHYPFKTREFEDRNFVFFLTPRPGLHETFYVRVASDVVLLPMTLSSPQAFSEGKINEVFGLGIYYGIIVVMIVYNLFLYLSVRDLNYLYYVLYILGYCVFQLSFTGLAFQYLWPNQPWWANSSVSFSIGFTTFWLVIFSRRFLETKRIAPIIDRTLLVMMSLSLGVCLCSFLAPYNIVIKATNALTILSSIVVMTAVVVCLKRGLRAARYFALAFTVLLVAIGIYVIKNIGLLPNNFFTHHGVTIGSAVELVLLSLALGDKIKLQQMASQKQIEDLNADLRKNVERVETMVNQKTRHIASVMTHIKQGIFTILPGKLIEKHYSDHLKIILEKTDIANKNPIDLFLRESSLTSDELGLVQSILETSLGEDALNFQMNSSHLPEEIILKGRIIELSWQNINDEFNRVEKILVVARDVTQFRALEEKSVEQREELARIEKLLAIPAESCRLYFTQARKFLEEIQRIIHAHQDMSERGLKTIYINYHTLKASSRAFKFSSLVDALHQAEEYCGALREGRAPWEQAKLLSDQQRVSDELAKYMRISSEKLGRSDNGRKSFDLSTVGQGLALMSELPGHMRTRFTEFERALFHACYKPSSEVFAAVFSEVPSLARQLSKPIPDIQISGPRVGLSNDAIILLSNVFTHLIRNSMDHGIEDAAQRESQGKPAQGQLRVELLAEAERLIIRFSDDGVGLRLNTIKQVAVEKNMLAPDEKDPAVIAALIFQSGFSTADKVTEISGRGVGMVAIREHLEAAGGTLSLNFLQEVRSIDQMAPVEFVITLEPSMYALIPQHIAETPQASSNAA